MSAVLGLLLVGAGIAIHVEDARGLEREEPMQLMTALGEAIFARTATTPRIDDPIWSECADADRCSSAIRQRTGASEIVLMRAFAAGKKMRVTVERAGSKAGPMTLDLERDPRTWPPRMTEVARALYAEGRAIFEPDYVPPPEPGLPIGPFIAGAAGAAMLGVGIGLGASSAAGFDALGPDLARARAIDPAASSASAQGIAANALIGAGLVAIAGGVWWWWSGWGFGYNEGSDE